MRGVALALKVIGRQRWRQWLVIVLISGGLAGAALAAGSAARRTSTAFPRMLTDSRIANAHVNVDQSVQGIDGAHRYLREIEALPQVGTAAREAGVNLQQVLPNGRIDQRLNTGTALALEPEDDRTFRTTELLRVEAGRLPAVDHADEIAINPELAHLTGWHIGSRPSGLEVFGLDAFDQNGEPVVGKGIPVSLTVVGIVRYPTELLASDDSPPRAYLSHAFAQEHPRATYYEVGLVHLRQPEDIGAFRDAVTTITRRYRGLTPSVVSTPAGAAAASKALQPQDAALWALFGIGLLSALVLLVQGTAATLRATIPDLQILHALGMSRTDHRRLCLQASALAALATAVLAIGVAWLLSPLGPIGAARAAEPHPGLSANLAVLGAGAGLLVILSVALSALPSARTAETAAGVRQENELRRPAQLSTRLARRGASMPAVVGVRLAFQRDQRTIGVSTSTAIAAVCGTILFATGSLVFVSSLNHLTRTPSLYGWNWTEVVVELRRDPGGPERLDRLCEAGRDLGVHRGARHDIGVGDAQGWELGVARVGSVTVPGLGIDSVRHGAALFPTIRQGRRPVAPDEVVAGTKTLKAIHAHLGSTVDATIDGHSRRLHIVGIATFPELGLTKYQETGLGEGIAGVASLFRQDPSSGGTYNFVFFRLRPGGLPQLVKVIAAAGCPDVDCVISEGRPIAVIGYAKARDLTLTGVGILAFALLVALSRAVVTTVRRRNGRLASRRGRSHRHRHRIAAGCGARTVRVGDLRQRPRRQTRARDRHQPVPGRRRERGRRHVDHRRDRRDSRPPHPCRGGAPRRLTLTRRSCANPRFRARKRLACARSRVQPTPNLQNMSVLAPKTRIFCRFDETGGRAQAYWLAIVMTSRTYHQAWL